jgi:hypothetical protein
VYKFKVCLLILKLYLLKYNIKESIILLSKQLWHYLNPDFLQLSKKQLNKKVTQLSTTFYVNKSNKYSPLLNKNILQL